tara:strand:- start:262 stop:843 length:582 start_codon:yes stop_codon:yes gene_type:complete
MADKAIEIWMTGGVIMIPLAILAVFIYFTAFELLYFFSQGNYRSIGRKSLEKWIHSPGEAEGSLGEVIEYSQEDFTSSNRIQSRFQEIIASHIPLVDRRLKFLSRLVIAAPLLGLLGTVIGMLKTFEGLAMDIGGVIHLTAGGISEALISTQTGLLIAIPGYILSHWVQRRRNERLELFVWMECSTLKKFNSV